MTIRIVSNCVTGIVGPYTTYHTSSQTRRGPSASVYLHDSVYDPAHHKTRHVIRIPQTNAFDEFKLISQQVYAQYPKHANEI